MLKVKPEIRSIEYSNLGLEMDLEVNNMRIGLSSFGGRMWLSVDGSEFMMSSELSPEIEEVLNFFKDDSYSEFIDLAGFGCDKTKLKQLKRVLKAKKTNQPPEELGKQMFETFYRSLCHYSGSSLYYCREKYEKAMDCLSKYSSLENDLKRAEDKKFERSAMWTARRLHDF